MKKTAIFSISSLGLGHATRTLPVLKSYLHSHEIHVISYGNALAFLKKELGEGGTDEGRVGVVFHEFAEYPPLERGAGLGWKFYAYLFFDSIGTIFVIRKEHRFVARLARGIRPEFIFSDGRYGSYVKGIPSFILSHQISFIMPVGLGFFQRFADYFNARTFRNFGTVFIPDYEIPDYESSGEILGGKLSHHPMLSRLDHRYVGLLSSLSQVGSQKPPVEKDIDFLFTVSGYLSEHKASFVDILVEQAKRLPGKKVFILGEPKAEYRKSLPEHGIEIYSSASGNFRDELFSRAKFVVSRAGYTTIMDLVELDLPVLLISTPGQTEQEYLAEFHGGNGHFLVVSPRRIDLSFVAEARKKIQPYKPAWKTAETVRKIRAAIGR